MFSGIITHTVKPSLIKRKNKSMGVSMPIPSEWQLKKGESININGICSTIQSLDNTKFSVFYMPETLDKTNLGSITKNSTLNLERCLTLKDLIGGHLVYGHIDTTAKVTKIQNQKDSRIIKFGLSQKFTKYIVYKGSITVNGVSLTVVSVTNYSFTVSLIPYTLSHTNLGEINKDDKVNIEVDMMAKHLEKLINSK